MVVFLVEWCNISEAKRDFDLDTKIPKELIQELTKVLYEKKLH